MGEVSLYICSLDRVPPGSCCCQANIRLSRQNFGRGSWEKGIKTFAVASSSLGSAKTSEHRLRKDTG